MTEEIYHQPVTAAFLVSAMHRNESYEKIVQSLCRDVGNELVVKVLILLAQEAIEVGTNDKLRYADNAAYLAHRLSGYEYLEAFKDYDKVRSKGNTFDKELRSTCDQLKKIQAELSYFRVRIDRTIRINNPRNDRYHQLLEALMCVWSRWDITIDGDRVQEACIAYLDSLSYRANLHPAGLSTRANWSIIPGSYLNFSELVRTIPKLREKIKKVAKLLKSKKRQLVKRNDAILLRGDAEKAVAKTLENLHNVIDKVGINELAKRIDDELEKIALLNNEKTA